MINNSNTNMICLCQPSKLSYKKMKYNYIKLYNYIYSMMLPTPNDNLFKELYELKCKEYEVLLQTISNVSNKNVNQTCNTNAFSLLSTIVDTEYENQESSNLWLNSTIYKINLLKNDYSGRVGELYINNLCKLLSISNIYNKDKNSNDGVYDMIILNKQVEIKTSRIGINGGFQHDGLRNNGSEYYLFLDIKMNDIFLTIIPHFDLSTKSQIMERTPHLRKGTSNVYKFDLSEKKLVNSIEKGYTILINKDSQLTQIKQFIERILHNN